MRLHVHIIVNLVLAVIAKLLFDIDNNLLAFFVLMTIVIDLDHPWPIVFREKTINIKKIYLIHQKLYDKCKHDLYVFHSPEVNILLGILSFFNPYFLAAFISNMIHMSMDAYHAKQMRGSISDLKNWSIIYLSQK